MAGRIGIIVHRFPKLSQTFIAQEIRLLEERGLGARRRVLDFFDSRIRIEDCERLLLASLRPPARPDQSYVARDPGSPETP